MAKHKVEDILNDIVGIQNQINGLNMLLEKKRALMKAYFEKSGERKAENDEVSVYVQTRTKVNYDIKAIRDKLPKSISSQFIDTERTISDLNWPKLVHLCKEYGIPPDELSEIVNVSRAVNQSKLTQLYEKGEISLDDLKDCYDSTTTKSIAIRLKYSPEEEIAHATLPV